MRAFAGSNKQYVQARLTIANLTCEMLIALNCPLNSGEPAILCALMFEPLRESCTMNGVFYGSRAFTVPGGSLFFSSALNFALDCD